MALGIKDAREWDNNPIWDSEMRSQLFWHDLVYPFPYPYSDELSRAIAELISDATAYPTEHLYFNGQALCVRSPESHVGPWRHAHDLVLPLGTEVLAPIDGKIIAMKDDSDVFGPTELCASKANYVTLAYRPMGDSRPTHHHLFIDQIWHCIEMLHLEQGSVSSLGLKAGDWVKRGQLIGRTGNSGWMTAPHLHFLAYLLDGEENPFGFYSQNFTFMSEAIHNERISVSWDAHHSQMRQMGARCLYFPRPYTGVHQSPMP